MHLVAILLFLGAQQFEHQDECIDPTMESMFWRVLDGEVQSVGADGVIRIVKVSESKRAARDRAVRLTDVEIDPFALPFLRSLIGKRVEVWINPHKIDDDAVSGVVYRGKQDINRTLLARGLGRYVTPAAYSLSAYSDCLHRIAEREARAARRGIWGARPETLR